MTFTVYDISWNSWERGQHRSVKLVQKSELQAEKKRVQKKRVQIKINPVQIKKAHWKKKFAT